MTKNENFLDSKLVHLYPKDTRSNLPRWKGLALMDLSMGPWSNYVMKIHLLEDKKIPSVGVFDEVYFSFGGHLDELHVNWAYLEKKRTRLRTNTKTLEDLCSQSLETASQAIHEAVTTHQVTASHHFMTALARTDSNTDLEDSSYDGVTTKT
ncbi:hypothetical protein Tco_0907909 [Tanacetum coccineum]|uniref:Uncharacterized protein n=1 Tax=Tanacetum coccineum TaxID=301880 RepID=A0ABQ5CLS2_9ASTR